MLYQLSYTPAAGARQIAAKPFRRKAERMQLSAGRKRSERTRRPASLRSPHASDRTDVTGFTPVAAPPTFTPSHRPPHLAIAPHPG